MILEKFIVFFCILIHRLLIPDEFWDVVPDWNPYTILSNLQDLRVMLPFIKLQIQYFTFCIKYVRQVSSTSKAMFPTILPPFYFVNTKWNWYNYDILVFDTCIVKHVNVIKLFLTFKQKMFEIRNIFQYFVVTTWIQNNKMRYEPLQICSCSHITHVKMKLLFKRVEFIHILRFRI